MSAGLSSAADHYDTAAGSHPFAEVVQSSQKDESASVTESNWAATIGLVQDVARRFRILQSSAHAVARDAGDALKSARADAAAAETRARDARTEADAAHQRADLAERQVGLLTRDLAAAGERIDNAERRVAELSAWLRDIHECMTEEFNSLTIAPS